VTNLRKMRKSFHGPRLGFSALVCVLACGSGDEEIGGVPDTPGSAETLAPRDDLRAPTFALESNRSISAIGEDSSGELYATDLGGGELLRIVDEGG